MAAVMDFDVVIAGSGVAGGSCALRLARQGARVALFDRDEFPRDKVCGEFLAPESVARLRELEFEESILAAGGLVVRDAVLHSQAGNRILFDLKTLHPRADHGLAISRSRLDQLLFESARKAGCHASDRVRVDTVTITGGQRQEVGCTDFRTGESFLIRCRFFVDAAGRKSRFTSHPQGRRSYFGYKTHWPEPLVPKSQVHLFFFEGGYGGATVIEGGRTSVSIMATPELFRNAQGDFSHLMAATVFQNRSAQRMLAGLDPSFARWITTGPLIFELKHAVTSQWIHLGDAAGMIDPFTGEGMTFALTTAFLLAEELQRGGNYTQVKGRFDTRVLQELQTCYRNCSRLRWIAARPRLLNQAFRIASRSRWIKRRLVEMTRCNT